MPPVKRFRFDPEEDYDTPMQVLCIVLTKYLNYKRQASSSKVNLTTYVPLTQITKYTGEGLVYIAGVCEHLAESDWIMFDPDHNRVRINPLKLPRLTAQDKS